MKKILIVDDHAIVLAGISSMLKLNKYTVIESTNKSQTIALLRHISDIDLMVCDLSLPTTADGMRLIEEAYAIRENLPVIVFTMHEELWNIKALMNIKVKGIVLKGDNPKELLCAVDSVLKGKEYFSRMFCRLRNEVMVANGILSMKEIEIIKSISLGRKNREIAESMCVSEKTIEFYRCSILHKLGAKTISEATRRACELGLLHSAEI